LEKKLAIIFPVKNEEKTIGQNIEIAKRHTDLIFCSDGGSTDNSKKIAKEKGTKILDASKGIGKGYAMKLGIKEALKENPDAIMFLDSDLENLEDFWIEKLVEGLKKYDRVQSKVRRIQGNGLVTAFTAKPLLHKFFPSFPSLDQPLIGEWVGTADLFRNLPLSKLPDDWGIDIAILLQAHQLGFSIGEVDLGFRQHASTQKYAEPDFLSKMADEVASAIVDIFGT